MESVRSKKVRSRRTPVANLASFAPRERLSANRDRRGAAASRTPPISAVRVRLTQPHLFRTAAPGHRVALPALVSRPSPRLPAPRKAYRRAPLRARQRPVVRARQRPPRRYAPLCEHPSNIRRGVLRTAAPHHVPTRRPALRLKGRTLVPRLRQPSPPLALIELQSHPRRSDEIAIHPRIAEALPKFAFHPFQKRVNGVA